MSIKTFMSPLQRFALWIEDYWHWVCTTLGSLFLALAGTLPSIQSKNLSSLLSTNYGKLFILGVFLSLIGGIKTVSSTPGNKSLTNEVRRLSRELDSRKERQLSMIYDELSILSQILKFQDNTRISLYKHEESRFVLLGRYSLSPELKKRAGGIYPDDRGFIAHAWRNGGAFVDNLPEPTSARYYQMLERDWNLPQDEAANLSMKSRTIGAFSISNSNNERIAVIVFESLRERAFREAQLREIIESGGEQRRIALLLEKLAFIEPASSYAYKEGY